MNIALNDLAAYIAFVHDSRARVFVYLTFASLAACGNQSHYVPSPVVSDAALDDVPWDAAGLAGPSAPEGPCGAVTQQFPNFGYVHVAECSYVTYETKPPSSGNHYPIWAAYRMYSDPIPEGYWVHNLEHGTIVVSYNCEVARDGGAQACEQDVAAAQAMFAALPDDPECVALGQGVNRRSLMTPDPKLDVPFAASAWTWTLRANCFDPVAFHAFAVAHYNQGREDICSNGEDLSAGVPTTCGAP